MNRALHQIPYVWVAAIFVAVAANFAVGLVNLSTVEEHFRIIAHTTQVIGAIDDASEALQTGKWAESKAKAAEAKALTADNAIQQPTFGQALAEFKNLPGSASKIKSLFWLARHRERALLSERIVSRDEAYAGARKASLLGGLLSLMMLGFVLLLIFFFRRDQADADSKIFESEARFEGFMENSPLRACIKDDESRMVWVSRKFVQFYPEADSWIGKNELPGVSKELAAQQRASDLEILKNGGVRTEYHAVTYHDGIPRDLMLVKFLLPSARGTMIGMFILDISEKVAVERRLEAYTRELENKNKELQNFASVAAHDLQEPLRKIETFGQQLDEQLAPSSDAEIKDNLGRIRGASRRMRTLIEDLLTYTRVSSRGAAFQKVDLNQALNQAISDLEIRILETRAKVSAPPLPQIEADATQMRQLFQNLISNSIKYCDLAKAPEINLKIRRVQNSVELSFSDNGIGFEPEYREKIFELFQRLHGRYEYSGTGLGLAICKKIVERHNGKISASGEPGAGATFIVTLPVTQKHQGAPS